MNELENMKRMQGEIDTLTAQLAAVTRERDEARAEVVRLRTVLNHIAWPAQYGHSHAERPPQWCVHAAQDALAIGVPATSLLAALAATGAEKASSAGAGGDMPARNGG